MLHKDVLKCSMTAEIYLDAILAIDVPNTLTQTFHARLCNNVPPGSIGWFCVVIVGIVDSVWLVFVDLSKVHVG